MSRILSVAVALSFALACDPAEPPAPTGPTVAECDVFTPDPTVDHGYFGFNHPDIAACEAAGCVAFVASEVYWSEGLDGYPEEPGYCHHMLWSQYERCAPAQPAQDTVDDWMMGTLAFGAPPSDPTGCVAVAGDEIPADWTPCADPAMLEATECSP